MIDLHVLIDRMRAHAAKNPDLDCDPDADIAWAQALQPPENPQDFALEIIFVICNSGMRYTVARGIFEKVRKKLVNGRSALEAFGHAGKAKAIDRIWMERVRYLSEYRFAEDKLAYIAALPWIGDITKYHVAKNFGLQYAKPDVHLQRLADTFGTSAQALCEQLARVSGYSVATVDTLLWRAAAVGVLNTDTGELT